MLYGRIVTYGKIELRSAESLKREEKQLYEEYLDTEEVFEDFLNDNYCASDFYKKEPNEEEINQKFKEYCLRHANFDTFGQYQEVFEDKNEKKPNF